MIYYIVGLDIYMCVHIHVYIYIYVERDIHIHIHIYRYIMSKGGNLGVSLSSGIKKRHLHYRVKG